jgi:hypothetical protein
MEIAKAH